MRLSAIAAGMALSVSATGAHAASVFELFQAMCVDSPADPAVALATAEKLKWRSAPRELVRALTKPSEPGEVVTQVAARGSTDRQGSMVVAVAQTSHMIRQREIPAQACVLLVGPSMDVAAIGADAASFAAVPAQSGLVTQKNAIAYLWREAENGQHLPLTPDDAAMAHPGRDVRMMVVMAEPKQKTSILQFFIPVAEHH